MEYKGTANRIRNCACELLSIGDDLSDDDESWDLVEKDLQLKSTFLYCDFSRIIACAPNHEKKSLAELANKLFCSIEELDNAVKIQSIPQAHIRFDELALILQEVVATLMPPAMSTSDRVFHG